MRKLLRDTRTGLYFKCPGQWTQDPEEAIDFRFTERALDYAKTWELSAVELAFQEPHQCWEPELSVLEKAA